MNFEFKTEIKMTMMEKKVKHRIEISAEGKAALAKMFNVTVQNVSQALLFNRNSVTCCRIREAALQHGGKLVEIREVPAAPRTVKILNQKGEVMRAVVVEDHLTL